MREFKVGDKVWTREHGFGVVESVDKTAPDSVYAIFPDGWDGFFFQDGHYNLDDRMIMLFRADEIPGQCAPASVEPMSRRDWTFLFSMVSVVLLARDFGEFEKYEHVVLDANKMTDLAITALDSTRKEVAK